LVSIGNFDGVHRGHQAVLADLARLATVRDLAPVVLTFDPHPLEVLAGAPPARLCTTARKRELVARVCPDIELVVRRFDAELAAFSPQRFAAEVLARDLRAAVVQVGENFRFGRERAGDFAALSDLGAELGFETRAHAMCGDGRGAWSSSRVREALAGGDVGEARAVLGRPHMVSGHVLHGDQRGRTIGFPTCNLGEPREALPASGVYAVLVDRVDAGTARVLAKGVANIGVRPTVAGPGARPTVEAHLFDVSSDLYGAELRVHLVARLRGEQRFAGLDELKAQIARDAVAARAELAAAVPDAAAGGAWS
jgi:riboflavin kinase/FMN adenylyltransferase